MPWHTKTRQKMDSTCEICNEDKRIPILSVTPDLLNLPELDLGPEDTMHIDLLPNLPPSGRYENIITAMDVFSRYLFLTQSQMPQPKMPQKSLLT